MDVAGNIIPVKTSSNNSIESDQEVRDITDRVAKLEATTCNGTSNGKQHQHFNGDDQNNNSTTKLQPDSPTRILENTSPFIKTNKNIATNTLNSVSATQSNATNGDSTLRQILAKNTKSDHVGGGQVTNESSIRSSDKELNNISLDTKVPHPLRAEFQSPELEEVSYYNDQVSSGTQMEDGKSIESVKARPKSLIEKESSRPNLAMPTACKQRHPSMPNSRDFLNKAEEDDYDTRYDNAIVESMTNFKDSHAQHSGQFSTPNSPKAKSAPATPCNVTPIAFHQHTSHLNSILNPSPANTLPPDIRKNLSATCRVLPSSVGAQDQPVKSQYLDNLIKRGETSLKSKDFHGAIRFFSQCIELATNNQNLEYLKKNFKVYSHRAEAHFYLNNYNEAIEDSMAARELNPKWTQAYYRQGRSQFLIGQYADSLAVFAFGLAQEPTNKRLFEALVDAALNSDFKSDFETKYNKLKTLDLDKKPFVVVSVLGQDVLAKGHSEHAAIILESALRMGADNKKFKGSVLSTIGYAYCTMRDYEKAVTYMLKELDVESELEDINAQCRVLSNLGYTYYKMRKFDKSLESHRKQLSLAMRTHLFQQASIALNAIGHVHAARNDFTSALTSHTRCLEILKQLGDNDYSQYRELLSIGHIQAMLGDYKAAQERYNEAIQLLESSCKIGQELYQVGLVMVNFNLAYLALKRQSFLEAKQYYALVIKLAQRIPNPKRALFEMRAFNGMGQTHRLFKKFDEARVWFEKQLQIAELLNDRAGQSQALSNLGMTYQHFKDYSVAWKYFEDNMRLVERDPLLKAYAHSYMGSMYFLMNRYNEAQAQYECSLNTFKDLDYCTAERKTINLNMAAVNERMGHTDVTQQKKFLTTQ